MRPDWWTCNGEGEPGRGDATARREGTSGRPATFLSQHLTLSPPLSRRKLLAGAGLAAVWWAGRPASALADLAITRRGGEGSVLVTLFMRGGADGLNIVIPHGEDAYHRNRPTLGLARPGDAAAAAADRALDLDGFFGFHPSLSPLVPLFHNGQLAAVHACGSMDRTRSHFEAMATMERGLATSSTGAASGWIARHLSATEGQNDSPLRAVALSSVMPAALSGATNATAVSSISDFRLYMPDRSSATDDLRAAVAELYEDGADPVSHAGRETLAVLDALNRVDPDRYRPANGAIYPKTELGNGFRQVACLIRGRVGMEVACLDRGGWDTHAAQGGSTGLLAAQLDDLARSIAAFAQDLDHEMGRVTVVVMTEFGRRLHENYTLGTDHGRGGVMLLMGGGVAGGKVHAQWPGLADAQLEDPGDLRVTTDYRDVLAEICAHRLNNKRLDAVFPGYRARLPGIVAA